MEQLQVPVQNHRDMESHQIFGDLLLLTGSGIGGREAAIVNLISSIDGISSISSV